MSPTIPDPLVSVAYDGVRLVTHAKLGWGELMHARIHREHVLSYLGAQGLRRL